MVLLDTRHGDVWVYGLTERTVLYLGQLTELGRPRVPSHNRPFIDPRLQFWPIHYARSVHRAPAVPALAQVPTSQRHRQAGLERL
jgi:hypothetical protein